MTSHPDSDPGSSSANHDLLDRLADEFAERFRRGERPSLKEYTDRYPDLADDIQSLFPALVDLEQADEVRQEAAADPDLSGAEPPPRAPALEQLGDYQVLREIGRGGMGVVYEAEQVSLGRRVALKILPHHVARDARMLERFRREARAAARLHHTNIVPVFEVGREGDVCYYAMQFILGQGLDLVYDELRRLRGRAEEPSETGARPIAKGTATHAHRAAVGQVVHSLLTGRFGDDPLPVPAGTVAGPSRPEEATGVFAPGTDAEPEPALARTEADSAAGDREKVATPATPRLGDASLPASAAASAVMPGGSQISTIESGRRDYARCIARIGIQAAQGLAYAHARGIVHRDIKPSNLLLDTAGVVWITDFGLAKAEGDGLTQTGDVLGTLRYMAPERFSGGGDVRADVYALGLTLYELLTLEPAFDAPDRLRLVEQIKSVDPVRPRLVDRRLPRDLETVILKAIEKDAQRRYPTADAFAEDLRRFRDDEPILARRSTAVERYVRWARRNPAVAVLGGVLTAVLVLVTAASLLVAGRMATLAERQRQTADSERVARLAESDARQHEAALRKQAEQARRDAEAALAEAQVERNRAEENFQRARAVVDQYFTQVSESQLLSVPGLQTLRRDLLGSALSFYEDYLARRGRDPGLSAALAAVHLKAARIHFELGDRAAAEKDYRGALALYEALARADPAPEARSGLAECHYGLALCGPAGTARRDALLRSAAIRQELVAAQPTDTRLREDLARSYQALGEDHLAAVLPTQPAPAGGVMSDQAEAIRQQAAKKVKEALDWFLKARDIAASLVRDHPDDPAYRHEFARNLGEIAECLCKLGRHQDETIIRPMAIEHARAAYEQAPHQVAYGRLYGHLAMREGNNLHSQKRYEESIRSLWQALQVQEKLIRENPAVPDLPRELLTTYLNIHFIGAHQGDPSDLVRRLRQSCELLEGLPLRGPDQLYVLTQLLALRANKPEPSRPDDEDEARRRQDSDLAADALRRAIAEGLGRPGDINALRNNARRYFPSLLARQDVTGMLEELESRRKADDLAAQKTPNSNVPAARPARKTQDADAAHRRLQADLAASEHAIALIHFAMGTTLQNNGDFDGALAELREAVRLRPADASFHERLNATLKARTDRDAALAEARRVTPAWEQSVAVLPANEQLKAVASRLKELNPGFDGAGKPTIENGVVTGLKFTTDHVKDISPVRVLTRLQKLEIEGSGGGKGSLVNLSPLKGMPLTFLGLRENGALTDLTPLKGMPLKNLSLDGTIVTDLSPLKGMPLTFLGLRENGSLTDLTPLKGMPLKNLSLGGTGVTDLSPLKGMPLEWLFMWGHGVSDLTPLKGMPLKWLNCGATEQKLDLTPLTGSPLDFLCINHTPVSDLAPLKDMTLTTLLISNTRVSDLSPLKGMKLHKLDAQNIPASDLAPLQGTPLTSLDLEGAHRVTDLKPLQGMPLEYLNLSGLPVSDLAVLKGMTSLRWLVLDQMPLSDLTPLRGLKLQNLQIQGTQVSDLALLKAFPLTALRLDYRPDREELLRSLKGLEHINNKPAAQFWKEVNGQGTAPIKLLNSGIEAFPRDPFVPADALTKADGGFRALDAAEQVEEVRKQLKKRNPGFDGSMTHKIAGGVVRELSIKSNHVTDLSPLRALVGLKVLSCTGAPLSDLSPLSGLPLTTLNLDGCNRVRDLGPLKGMPLASLSLDLLGARGQVRDLSPLKGMPLTALNLNHSLVQDLTPLKGMPLTRLNLNNCIDLQDLNPLKGMPLTALYIGGIYGGTKVRDLSPLADMKLTFLNCSDALVCDLSPLKGMPLEDIRLTPKNMTQGLDILRDMKSLKTIGINYARAWPAAEFWDRYDKGQFEAKAPEPASNPTAAARAGVEPTRNKLIGQKAAPLAVEAWVNGSPVTDDDLKGKVVLLDFWAVWCGPCIATFPHLREWNEKYAGKGLVMIGLTNHDNYDWDEQAGKVRRSEDKVAPEEERAMLEKFAAQHKLTHRLGIQKEHALSKYYGVTGIPQVVVIDREGVVRLIKVGSGEANVKAIGELLETLLAPGEP